MRPITTAELVRESGEILPARETLALFSINIAPITAVNVVVALNAATINSVAGGQAGQWIAAALHG